MPAPASRLENALTGCLLGTAVGDALGLPLEGLSRERQRRRVRDLTGHRFFFGRGMISDDTEHACMTAQAVIGSGADPARFAGDLARRLRDWFLALPAGIGFATLRSILKLLVGAAPENSGVFSAGNGPAMRSPLLGVAFGEEPETLRALVRASTRITHTDPKAEYGALAVALAAHAAARGETSPQTFLGEWKKHAGAEAAELTGLIERAVASHGRGETTEVFADALGLQRGVTGYMYHTVPMVLHLWFRHPRDMRAGLLTACRLGGDTDTVGAILGGILGAGTGPAGIPPEWLETLVDWPRSVAWIERLAGALARSCAGHRSQSPPEVPFVFCFLRNVFFTAVVLSHGFYRLLPPY